MLNQVFIEVAFCYQYMLCGIFLKKIITANAQRKNSTDFVEPIDVYLMWSNTHQPYVTYKCHWKWMNGPGVISHFLQAMGAHPRFPNFVCCCHKSYFVSAFRGVFIIKKSIHHTSLNERERQREHFCRV